MKKTPGKSVLTVLSLLLVALAAYYTGSLLLAWARTPAIVRAFVQSEHTRLSLHDLSAWQIHALLAVEDPAFYQHHGIDLHTPGAGLTTLTQALAKQMYFHPFKPGIRKIKLMLLARLVLDPLVSKDDQLALFVNHIYLGNVAGKPAIGFAEAAQAYYGKEVGRLTEYEYLSIVAMIIAPRNFHILDRPAANEERTRRVQKVVSGEYQPMNLMDVYYGPLDDETRKGLAPASYFPSIYIQSKNGR